MEMMHKKSIVKLLILVIIIFFIIASLINLSVSVLLGIGFSFIFLIYYKNRNQDTKTIKIIIIILILIYLVGVSYYFVKNIKYLTESTSDSDKDYYEELTPCRDLLNDDYKGCRLVENSLCMDECQINSYGLPLPIPGTFSYDGSDGYDHTATGANIIGIENNGCFKSLGARLISVDIQNETRVRDSIEKKPSYLPSEDYCLECSKINDPIIKAYSDSFILTEVVGYSYSVSKYYCPSWIKHLRYEGDYYVSLIRSLHLYFKNGGILYDLIWHPEFLEIRVG